MSEIIPANTNVWGPGVWMTLHILSYTSDTLIKAKLFIATLLSIVNNLPCKKCRKHSIDFIKNNNYNPYIKLIGSNKKHIGPFKYICKMHNNANKILGKPVINWLQAYEKYSNISEMCDGPCDDDKIKIKDKIMKFVHPEKPDIKVVFVDDGPKKTKYNFK